MTHLIAFNLLYIGKGNLTGPGYYGAELVKAFSRLPEVLAGKYRVCCYIQPEAHHHFADLPPTWLTECRDLGGRLSRVLYEQIALPLRARHDGVDLLFSPAFVSPLIGAPHLVVGICDMYYRAVPELVERFQRQYWRVMIPLSAWRSESIITISECSGDDIERYLPYTRGKVTVTPLASRMRRAAVPTVDAMAKRAKPYVLMVANLTPNKNCEVVVDAVHEVRLRGYDIEFLHVGKDHLRRLEAAIARVGANDFVHTLGKVSDTTLAALYERCLCVVTPSFYEGFGMPAAEAQAMGAALISSDRGALPEVTGEGAILFDPTQPTQLADAIHRLIEDPTLRESLRQRGRTSARRFSWERTARETFSVFDRILHG